MPKVSVIVPVYNAENTIKSSVKSLLCQTLCDIEVLLVNDGSADASLDICRQIADSDDRVRVFDKSNGGAASARNLGLDNACGEYVAFCDADDSVKPDMYERMYNAALQKNCDLVLCDYLVESKNANTCPRTFNYPSGFYDKNKLASDYYPKLIMDDCFDFPPTVTNCVLLIKRSVIEDNHIRYKASHKYCEDEMFGCLCALHSNSFYYLKGDYLYHYKYNCTSTSNTLHLDEWEVFKGIVTDMYSEFKNSDFDFAPQIDTLAVFFAAKSISTLKSVSLSDTDRRSRIKAILDDPVLKNAFRGFKLPKRISARQKIYLLFIKFGLISLLLKV